MARQALINLCNADVPQNCPDFKGWKSKSTGTIKPCSFYSFSSVGLCAKDNPKDLLGLNAKDMRTVKRRDDFSIP